MMGIFFAPPKATEYFSSITSQLKRCPKCGRDFPPSREFFYADARTPNGLMCYCKSCHSKLTNGLRRPEYRAWLNMKQRCHNPNAANYRWYGAKGVRVCARWMESFEAFIADLGPRPATNYTVSRTDDSGNYEPGNCRWATWTEQHATRIANRRKRMYEGTRYPCGRLKVPHNKMITERSNAQSSTRAVFLRAKSVRWRSRGFARPVAGTPVGNTQGTSSEVR